jgi:hypothetical protein
MAIVYCVMLSRGDGCTWNSDDLHKIYANRSDAETEVTRIELLVLKHEEIIKDRNATWEDVHKAFTDEEQQFLDCDPWISDYEVL